MEKSIDKNIMMTHVAYVRDYLTTSQFSACANCDTVHRGACPIFKLFRRLASGVDPATHIEACVLALTVGLRGPTVVDNRPKVAA